MPKTEILTVESIKDKTYTTDAIEKIGNAIGQPLKALSIKHVKATAAKAGITDIKGNYNQAFNAHCLITALEANGIALTDEQRVIAYAYAFVFSNAAAVKAYKFGDPGLTAKFQMK